jgi:hypothetical protein
MGGGVELVSVIRQLRSDLNDGLDGAEGERLRFELGPVSASVGISTADSPPGPFLSMS